MESRPTSATKNKGRKETMDYLEFLRKKIMPVLSFLVFLVVVLTFISSYVSYINSIDEVDKGYISEKRYVPSSSFLLGHTDTHYRIYISAYYEGVFGMTETEKYFVVEKEVFDQYKVGDFFDSTII